MLHASQRPATTSESFPGKAAVANEALADKLDRYTALGKLWRTEGNRIRCVACRHRCLIPENRRGICKVRFNRGGQLHVPFGYVSGIACDPIEKKPFFHVYPGSDALTFGMLGCDLHCSYCQNWITSQALRDPESNSSIMVVTPEQIVRAAVRDGARLVVSSYNEPLITSEWAAAIFEKAGAAGLLCAYVSNGNATAEVLDFLQPWIAAYKVDLKTFDDQRYRRLGGTLASVLKTIEMLYARGIWLEVLTLVVPDFNSDAQQLRGIARFIASISKDIPWHVTAFHQDYKMTGSVNTTARDLLRAAEIGAAEGLHYVYAGNWPGYVEAWENTRCPNCKATLIERYGYLVQSYQLTADGKCPYCQTAIPGRWPKNESEIKASQGANHYARMPRRVAL
jgi:pyruvate formate lyase activating enzyme